ncbi:MAG TPA: MBL fold metallo-hydrolase, partial [Myxococcota bacterium]|nr:MBL fold metallo-hydrolase [Myxococcota bacterium]
EAFITGINHASTLVQLPTLTVLTDPVFAERVSPLSWFGPKRVRAPGLDLDALPPVDAVVVSHNHYDHLDIGSLAELRTRHPAVIIVPLGNKPLLDDAGITRVVELDWWQTHTLPGGGAITLVPAQHWSARGLLDRSTALWGGYVLEAGDVRVFFAGDTGYGPHFRQIAARFGPMDVSLLPIGAYEPRWFMRAQHMNPDDAVLAHLDLGSRHSLGMHWGTFQLTDEALDAPPRELATSLASRGVAATRFEALDPGRTWHLASGPDGAH